jgi:hypothetical protein
MSIILQERFLLDEKQIDYISEKIAEFSKVYKIDRKNIFRTRLTLEELLLRSTKGSAFYILGAVLLAVIYD